VVSGDGRVVFRGGAVYTPPLIVSTDCFRRIQIGRFIHNYYIIILAKLNIRHV
jgi:hypothetical protein